MKTSRSIRWPVVASLALSTALVARLAWAQHDHEHHDMEAPGHSHEQCEIHGGSVVMTPAHHFETLFTDDSIHMYAYDGKQNPILDPAKAQVQVTLEPKDGKPEKLTMEFVAPDPKKGRTQGYFTATHNFEGFEPGTMKALFHVEGMSEKPIDFKTSVQISAEAHYTCPMHSDVMAEDPGNCPKCGMHLQQTGGHEEGEHDSMNQHEHGQHHD